jgi:hypothetical protein
MKTKAEYIFDKVIKDCFHKTLKPLGFKKKGNNFYLPLPELGQIINVQKSSYGSKTNISFTINTGIFIPEYFLAVYAYENEIPDYPIEPVCAVRQRIGELRGENDKWYEINDNTNEQVLLAQMQENLDQFILPYFAKLSTRALLIQALDASQLPLPILGKLMLYGELKEFEKAKQEYALVTASTRNIRVLTDAKELMAKYGLD